MNIEGKDIQINLVVPDPKTTPDVEPAFTTFENINAALFEDSGYMSEMISSSTFEKQAHAAQA